jgi:DNA-binding transcriptional MerR regulator
MSHQPPVRAGTLSGVADGEDEVHELTIDELAQRTGMTVRNIRAHQSRGLLPSPEVRGRTGFYGREHVARLDLIRELQGQGFNLEAIRHLVDAGSASTELLQFTRAAQEPFEAEQPEVVTAEELAERWEVRNPKLLERAISLGLLRPLGDGQYEEVSPRLARAGDELRELGIPMDVALGVLAKVRRHADGVADAYVRLFIEQVWKPFEAAGAPEERWPEIRAALERLRPLAGESLAAVFGIAMGDAVDDALGRELARMQRRARKG